VDTVELPDGRRTTREIVEHSECVAVVPVDTGGIILLVRQFRHAAGKYLLEIPAGGIDPGEDAEAAVRREMGEETGFSPKTVKRLGGFYSSPGFCTEYLHLYLATDLVPKRLEADDTEGIEVVRTPVGQIPGLIDDGAICDSKSVAGLLTYLRTRK
jgi:ADP-ribose pyrophosphatase